MSKTYKDNKIATKADLKKAMLKDKKDDKKMMDKTMKKKGKK